MILKMRGYIAIHCVLRVDMLNCYILCVCIGDIVNNIITSDSNNNTLTLHNDLTNTNNNQ